MTESKGPYKGFIVQVEPHLDAGGKNYLIAYLPGNWQGYLELESLPTQVRTKLSRPGQYQVRRVEKGGIPVRLRPAPRGLIHKARYADSDAFVCDELCEKVGYGHRKPETICVTIKKIVKRARKA